MYGAFVLLDEAGKLDRGERVYLGDVKAKDEAWLRDTLFNHSEIIPVSELDSAYGPLVPLCTELRTDAGPIDAVFINEHGRLTIIECKLWKNSQARREVVAQSLDYVSALNRWTYADLQRQVSAAVGKQGNVPYELVRRHTGPRLREPEFIDAAARSLREGRILVLLAGDGIREGVQSLTELVSRNASKAFTFGIVEVAIYRFGRGQFAIQPRVLAKTEVVTRHSVFADDDLEGDAPGRSRGRTEKGDMEHLRAWWEPVIAMEFDDPDQVLPAA
jgi:hypothetical protein